MMQHRYPCDIVKLFLACISIVVFTGLFIGCLANRVYVPAIIFCALDVVYIWLAVKNTAIVYMDDEVVEQRIFGRTVLSMKWDEIEEVGRIGKRYVYFSREKMQDIERKVMCVNWSPKDKIFFLAGRRASEKIELMWNRRNKHFIRYKPERLKPF